MPIRCEHVEKVHTTPERAFAAIDNLPLTSKWLPPCVTLEKIGSGPNAPGDKLRYVFRQGRKTGQMTGEIRARTPGQRLYCNYADSTFEVGVDLRVGPGANQGETLMTHIIEITPKRFFAGLMSPLIRLGLGKQTRATAGNLKQLLESGSS